MIHTVSNNIINGLEDYSVILHQVNTYGTIQYGISASLCKKFPQWFVDYKSYCSWFSKDGAFNYSHHDYTDEIIGTWHKYEIPEKKIIICSAFGQIGTGKDQAEIDLDAWNKILKKLILQTNDANKNRSSDQKWKIHIPHNIGCISKTMNNSELIDLFNTYFESSDIDLYIHQTII